jgi:hypothetical protein
VGRGKHQTAKFPIQNGLKHVDALSPLLFNFALEYAIRRVQENVEGVKLNWIHQVFPYADDLNMVGGNVDTVKHIEALLDASKEVGLEVNPENTKYMLMSRSQKIRQKHSIKAANGSVEDMANFKYLGTTQRYHNCMHKVINSRLNSGIGCYHSGRNLLSSRLLSRNLAIILPVVLYGCETWSLTLREEYRLRMFENRVLRRVFVAKGMM